MRPRTHLRALLARARARRFANRRVLHSCVQTCPLASKRAVRNYTVHHFFLVKSTSRSFKFSSKLSALSSTRFPDAATVAAISRAASILRSVRNDGLFWMASPSSCALFASPANAASGWVSAVLSVGSANAAHPPPE